MVACDPTVLATLRPREYRAGFYEVVKYGVIASRPLFDRVSDQLPALLKQDREVLTGVIAECCRIKADVVGRDEREGGHRRTLNFGHTVGHALEALTSYRRFRHGEAIGYGMLAAARLSAMRGLLSAADEARLQDVITRLGKLPPVGDLKIAQALKAIQLDKKVDRGTLNFVLAEGLGQTRIVRDVTPAELTTAMRAIGMAR
jgi:3-dehydroquinate synthase